MQPLEGAGSEACPQVSGERQHACGQASAVGCADSLLGQGMSGCIQPLNSASDPLQITIKAGLGGQGPWIGVTASAPACWGGQALQPCGGSTPRSCSHSVGAPGASLGQCPTATGSPPRKGGPEAVTCSPPFPLLSAGCWRGPPPYTYRRGRVWEMQASAVHALDLPLQTQRPLWEAGWCPRPGCCSIYHAGSQ